MKQNFSSKFSSATTDLQSKLEEKKAALAQLKAKQDLELKAIEQKIAQETAKVELEKKKQAIDAQAEQYREKFKLEQAKKALDEQKVAAKSSVFAKNKTFSLKSAASSRRLINK